MAELDTEQAKEWGGMAQQLATLTLTIEDLKTKNDDLRNEVSGLKASMNKGWGLVVGITSTVGFIMGGGLELLKKFLANLVGG
jgi:hypothetical protein